MRWMILLVSISWVALGCGGDEASQPTDPIELVSGEGKTDVSTESMQTLQTPFDQRIGYLFTCDDQPTCDLMLDFRFVTHAPWPVDVCVDYVFAGRQLNETGQVCTIAAGDGFYRNRELIWHSAIPAGTYIVHLNVSEDTVERLRDVGYASTTLGLVAEWGPTGTVFLACDSGATDCGGCVDLMTDNINCGDCGVVCQYGRSCDLGQCVFPDM